MNFSREEEKKLKQMLRAAYWKKEQRLPDDAPDTDDLMSRIRQLGPPSPDPDFLTSFEQLVWRLVPVASLFVILFTGVLLTLDLTPGYDVFQLLLNGREEYNLPIWFAA